MNQNNDGELALTDSSRNIDRSVDHNKVYSLSSWTSSSLSNKEIALFSKNEIKYQEMTKDLPNSDFSWTDYASNMATPKQISCNLKNVELGFSEILGKQFCSL